MLHTKFQASEHSGSKEEDLLIFFMYFYGSKLGPPWPGPILDSMTYIEQFGEGPLGNAAYQTSGN